jgi:hypothetical protein
MNLPSSVRAGIDRTSIDRRRFIKSSTALAAGLAMSSRLGRAQEVDPEIESIVRLIEETDREKCFDAIGRKLHEGLTPRDFVAALYYAGVRNVRPHPLGFKFHCVLGVHAAHQLGNDVGGERGLLPLFWMLDDFKNSQEKDRQEGDYRMGPVSGPLPGPEAAEQELTDALDKWDEERADRAMAVLARTQGAQRISSLLWQYGARDFRNIGHKATYVAGALRVLDTIGWQQAEPVLRSVATAMTDFGHDAEVNGFTFESQCYLSNRRLLSDVDAEPLLAVETKNRHAATQAMFGLLRTAPFGEACQEALKSLQTATTDVVALWDAVVLSACDLIMRRRGIFGIHAVTSIHGLHYAYVAAAEPSVRLLMLFQAIGWICQFRYFMDRQEPLSSDSILELQPTPAPPQTEDALDLIFASVGGDHPSAAALALHYGGHGGSVKAFKQRARHLLVDKTVEVHGWKYPAACFELLDFVSPVWQPHVLVGSTYYLAGVNQSDSPVMVRAKEVLNLK